MRKVLLLLSCSVVLDAQIARADFVCSSDVTYKWKEEGVGTPAAGSANSEKAVHFSITDAAGDSEEAAKAKLSPLLIAAKARAALACQEEHENQSKCIATKYSAMSTVVNSLSFSARKELEESIISDCKKSQGKCLEASSSDPKCSEVKKAEATPQGGSDAKSETKGDSKKKK